MKSTLLELVQSTLTSMDSDEVDSINDTAEARSIAELVRQAYFNIIARANLTEHQQLFQLDSSGDNTKPVLMTRPSSVVRMDWVKYDTSDDPARPTFAYVTVLPLQQYLELIHNLDLSESNVDSMTVDGQTFFFRNDTAPCYCAVLKDQNVVFDAYDNAVDTTLQTSKSMCFGLVSPTFSMVDSFVPDMDELQFPLLLNEVKSQAFIELKQVENANSQKESKRQWTALQKTKELKRGSYFDQLPDFGRR